MFKSLKDRGYKQTSLSVQKENYAVKMYRNVGFKIVKESEEYLMINNLKIAQFVTKAIKTNWAKQLQQLIQLG